MSEILTEIQARVIGALVEKHLTTPEYYPLTLNALVNACNQKTNREPVTSYTEAIVQQTLDDLRDKNLVYVFYGSTSRVPKYKHIFGDYFELESSEIAVVCVLMLRGAQTLGELRERTHRLYEFSGVGEVGETLDNLSRRDEPLIVKLERQAGQKEARFAHLLSGEVTSYQPPERVSRSTANDERIEKLEQEVTSLRSELNDFRQNFEEFKKQFE